MNNNPCFGCGFWDSDCECCTCPGCDMWYACPIESQTPENQAIMAEFLAEWDKRHKLLLDSEDM